MKFSQIGRAPVRRKRGLECTTLGGASFTYDLHVLNAEQESICLAAACKAAREAGGEPNETDLTYQMNFAIHLIALATIDPESPDDDMRLFFDGGADQVRAGLDRERTLLIAEEQRRFQEGVSPRVLEIPSELYISTIQLAATLGEGEELPFSKWPRQTLEAFAKSMATQIWVGVMGAEAAKPTDEPKVH